MSYEKIGSKQGVTYGVQSDGAVVLLFQGASLVFYPDDLHEIANDASDHEVTEESDLVAVDRDDLKTVLEHVAIQSAELPVVNEDVDEAAQRLEEVLFD